MTNPKLYYDDPLAAAYMVREFCVRVYGEFSKPKNASSIVSCEFIIEVFPLGNTKYEQMVVPTTRTSPTHEIELVDTGEIEELKVPGCEGVKFVVHPDSHHVFEPQEGDLLTNKHFDPHELIYEWQPASFFEEGEEIIRRNGKPFFMPEREE